MLFDIDKKILDAIEDEHEFESVHDSGIRRDKVILTSEDGIDQPQANCLTPTYCHELNMNTACHEPSSHPTQHVI